MTHVIMTGSTKIPPTQSRACLEAFDVRTGVCFTFDVSSQGAPAKSALCRKYRVASEWDCGPTMSSLPGLQMPALACAISFILLPENTGSQLSFLAQSHSFRISQRGGGVYNCIFDLLYLDVRTLSAAVIWGGGGAQLYLSISDVSTCHSSPFVSTAGLTQEVIANEKVLLNPFPNPCPPSAPLPSNPLPKLSNQVLPCCQITRL